MDNLDVRAAHCKVGTHRGVAAMCGTPHRTARRVIEADDAPKAAARKESARNYDAVFELV